MVKKEMLLQTFKVFSVGIFLETAVKGDGCKNYTILSDATRFINYFNGAQQILSDKYLETEWYRFMGQAGNRMQDHCPRTGRFHCQTYKAGWLYGTHPKVVDGEVERQVCLYDAYEKDCCEDNIFVKVKNCGNQYYIYQLKPTKIYTRYCGTGVGK